MGHRRQGRSDGLLPRIVTRSARGRQARVIRCAPARCCTSSPTQIREADASPAGGGTASCYSMFARTPRVRLMVDDGSDTYKSVHRGVMSFAVCFFGAVRDPNSHEDGLPELPEQEALEQLGALSRINAAAAGRRLEKAGDEITATHAWWETHGNPGFERFGPCPPRVRAKAPDPLHVEAERIRVTPDLRRSIDNGSDQAIRHWCALVVVKRLRLSCGLSADRSARPFSFASPRGPDEDVSDAEPSEVHLRGLVPAGGKPAGGPPRRGEPVCRRR